MRQVWIERIGGPEVLTLREAPDPTPAASEVRIRVAASGVNFSDVLARLGRYQDAPPLPAVIGYEVAGVVDALGPDAVGGERSEGSLAPGDAVVALTRFGGYSDVVCVPAAQVIRRPPGMDARIGAAFSLAYGTAYALLIEVGRIRAGDRVLVRGAGGGVGLAALDICGLHGVETFGTASAKKHAFLRQRGLTHPIDPSETDVVAEVRRLTANVGVDLVLDPIGGRSWRDSLALLAPLGKLAVYGFSAMAPDVSPSRVRSAASVASALAQVPWLQFNPISLMNANRGVQGLNLGHLWDRWYLFRQWFDTLLRWYEEGKLQPHVDRDFPLADAAAAHRYVQERRNLGKVVLIP
ncbi:MAG TPA: zinc-binding dehydrogenase [Chloroflexota bacterium]|nr:zinc-binding dehydrogenase [Chloroflexota bacterium]